MIQKRDIYIGYNRRIGKSKFKDKEKNYLGLNGKDPMYHGKDTMYQGKDPSYLGKDPLYPGMDPLYPGKDSLYPGKDPLYPGKDPLYPGKDLSGVYLPGKDYYDESLYSGRKAGPPIRQTQDIRN